MSGLFGGGSDGLPSPKQKPFGADVHRISTSEQARPITMLCGKQRVGVTFISRAFNIRTVRVTKSTGKKDTTVGYDYYASLAAAVCLGPVDELTAIYFNGELEWSGSLLRSANPTSAEGILANLKNSPFTIYWGTEDQASDPHLNDGLIAKPAGVYHPAYRGLCYLVFNQLFFGFNQTNVQNLEVVVARYPVRPWLANVQVGDDANPVAFVADLLQHHRGGLAMPDEQLNTAELSDVAEQLEEEVVGISPWLDRAQESKQSLMAACEYFDGFPKISADGKFSLGLVRAPVDVGALPVISETHFTKRPQFSPEDWTTAASETRTVFTNGETEFKEDATPAWRDAGAREIIGEPHALVLQRPWFTRPALANSYNQSVGPLTAVPKQKGKLYLRRTGTIFEDLIPGALFKLNYASRNLANHVMRVTDRFLPDPAKPEFEITVAVDRSYIYTTPPAIPEPSEPDEPEIEITQPLYKRIVELPLALCLEGKLSLAVLIAREDEVTLGYAIHVKKDYAFEGAAPLSYEQIATSTNFAKCGAVTEEFAAGEIVDEIGLLVTILGADKTFDEQTPWDALANDLLIFVDDEILSVHRIEVVSAGAYRFFTVRGRYATKQAAHVVDAEVFIIERKNIEAQQHPLFQPFVTANLKVVPAGLNATDVADIDPIEVEIVGKIYQQTPPTNLCVDGNEVDPTYETGDDISIQWTLTDAARDLWQRRLLTIKTVLEFLVADVVVATEEIDDGVSEVELLNADLIAAIGSEVSFTIRAKTKILGAEFILESDPIELAVTKI